MDWLTGNLYLSTSSGVYCIENTGSDGSVNWFKSISGASVPVVVPNIDSLYVGGGDGNIHQISLDGNTVTTIQIGSGTSTVGAPAFDFFQNVIYAGSEAGKVYIVDVPF